MTEPAYHLRRSSARGGWVLVAAGWLTQVPAAAGVMFVSDLFFVLSLLGVACVGAGCHVLRGKGTVAVILGSLFGGLVMVVGVMTGAETLAKSLWGETADCQVQGVQRRATTETTRDADGRPTGRRTVVFYAHELACPDQAHTVNGARPRPEGSTVKVRHDPRGSDPPEFTDEIDAGLLSFSAAALALGGVIEMVLPIVAWRRGRRPAGGPPPPPPSYAAAPPPGQGYPPGGPARGEPVPLESPRFEQSVHDSMGRSMSPPARLALPFIVRLLRRRMGVTEAPPPNPLAGRYPAPPPPAPPPQGPPVHRPPPRDAPPYGR
ncbi:MAG TPA: hypothetical protein VE465_12080 [Streptosporangiaceae bacterium]|nr:hypothetical protein [Streptosporangiaceae bacterium]